MTSSRDYSRYDRKGASVLRRAHSSYTSVQGSKTRTLFTKARKVVAALFLVSDLFADGDPMQGALREECISLLRFTTIPDGFSIREKRQFLESALRSIELVLSYLEVEHLNNTLSAMNVSLLSKELLLLHSSVYTEYISLLDGTSTSRSDRELLKIFEGTDTPSAPADSSVSPYASTASSDAGTGDDVSSHPSSRTQALARVLQAAPTSSEDRRMSLFRVIKDMGVVSSQDLRRLFPSWSGKTIQRDLAFLIDKGYLKKEGTKRWTQYAAVS